MANTFELSLGLVPNDTGESMPANTFYLSVGLVPDDAAASGGPAGIKTIHGLVAASVKTMQGLTFSNVKTLG